LDRLDALRQVRLEKLARLRELGHDPYPATFHRTHTAQEIITCFEELAEKAQVTIAGRLLSLREMGKTAFGHLQDGSGRIQVYLRRDSLGEELFALIKLLDLGDILGVQGVPFRTRTGEITVRAETLTILCKSLSPLPVVKEKEGRQFDSVTDKEYRYRHRHIDLILNPQVREIFELRGRVIRALRRFLDERGFLEVETPVLQDIYGGAMARPFTTHHNALSMDLYLRIALELHLKRLLIGGIERVYELGRTFRNEGMDRLHNPEFTMLEFYWAYADYHDAMEMVEELVRATAREAVGTLQIRYDDREIDLTQPFDRLPMRELIEKQAGIDIDTASDETMLAYLNDRGEQIPRVPGRGPLIEYLFDAAVVPELTRPTFVLDHPRSISPLTKAHRDRPEQYVERFELFIAGSEYANAFSELNDPLDQRSRLEEQAARRAMGDEEAQQLDEDFLAALEQGMPPAAGVGIGVDRLVMLLAGAAHIRDVLCFPQMRPEEGVAGAETTEEEGTDPESQERKGTEPESPEQGSGDR
jgi:lysyl-tRNA synthetase class 2